MFEISRQKLTLKILGKNEIILRVNVHFVGTVHSV
jgi:hypothetical protein